MMEALAGPARVQRKTVSHTTGESTGSVGETVSRQRSTTENVAEHRDAVLDATLFRHLTPNQAVALLSLQGRSMDDVLELVPLFV